jgi:hypothetical protein
MAARDTALRLAFLAWLAEKPRTYGEAMDAWRSTCPRMTVWEDAVLDGLVHLQFGVTKQDALVELSEDGRCWLERGGRHPRQS